MNILRVNQKQKWYIDQFASDEVQACFNMCSTSVFSEARRAGAMKMIRGRIQRYADVPKVLEIQISKLGFCILPSQKNKAISSVIYINFKHYKVGDQYQHKKDWPKPSSNYEPTFALLFISGNPIIYSTLKVRTAYVLSILRVLCGAWERWESKLLVLVESSITGKRIN